MNKAFVRAAEYRDADAICSLLHSKMNSRIPVDRWRQLMDYQWFSDKPDFGRVVESNGEVLGYCGMIYADRLVGDARQGLRRERIVSMSSWYLDKSLRGQGLGKKMLVSAIEDPDLTYATLTNSKKPLGIVEALGFRVLEDHRYIWRKTVNKDSGLTVTDDAKTVRKRVVPEQQRLLDDMQGLPLVPLLLETQDRQALIFLSIKRKGADVLWHDLMYSSDLDFFVECAQDLANELLHETSAVLAADGRFVRQAPIGIEREELPVARYYISQRVARHEIDHLYSELQLLDLKLE